MFNSIQKFFAFIGLLFIILMLWTWMYQTNINVNHFKEETSIKTKSTNNLADTINTINNVNAIDTSQDENQNNEKLSIEEMHQKQLDEQRTKVELDARQTSLNQQTDLTKQYLERSLNQQQQIINNQQRMVQQQQMQIMQQQQQVVPVPYGDPNTYNFNYSYNSPSNAARARNLDARTNQMNYENNMRNFHPHQYSHQQRVLNEGLNTRPKH